MSTNDPVSRFPIGPVVTFYGQGDAGWAACLMLDLRARGVEVWDHRDGSLDRASFPERAGAFLVIRSWFGDNAGPTDAETSALVARNGAFVVVRRNRTKTSRDDHPGPAAHVNLFEDDYHYYQPERSRAGRGSGGFAHLLELFLGPGAKLDLPDGYVFISYHEATDRPFVREQLRPCLSRAGIASWDYRTSERVPDPETKQRLRHLIERASALLVVATSHWFSPWTAFEVATARRQEPPVPVLAVRPATAKPSRRAVLDGVPIEVMKPGREAAPGLIAALLGSGVRPVG